MIVLNMETTMKRSLLLTALLLASTFSFQANAWSNMKNKKGKQMTNLDHLQVKHSQNVQAKAARDAIMAQQAAIEANLNSSRDVVSANPLSGVSATGSIAPGLCFTVCNGARISHPCGVQSLCQNAQSAFIRGCTDKNAKNFNPNAKADDGSCAYSLPDVGNTVAIVPGCMDKSALNFSSTATFNEPSLCKYQATTCTHTCGNGDIIQFPCGGTPRCPFNDAATSPRISIFESAMPVDPKNVPKETYKRPASTSFKPSNNAVQGADF